MSNIMNIHVKHSPSRVLLFYHKWEDGGEMETDVIKYFLTQGPFAVLFVWLLIYVMRNNKERELRLQALLDKFSEKYDVIISEIRDLNRKVTGRE